MLLSIIVPVLGPSAEMTRCLAAIDAAFAGTTEQPEVVVVCPPAAVDALRAQFPRARMVVEARRGIYAAMNDGARASTGDYLYFMGSDDVLLPAVQQASQMLARDKPFALSCDVFWGRRERYRGHPGRWRFLLRNLCHQGLFYSRLAFERHGPYLRRMHVQADQLLNLRVLWDRDDGHRVMYCPEAIAWYAGAGYSELHQDRLYWRLYPTALGRSISPWARHAVRAYRFLRGAG